MSDFVGLAGAVGAALLFGVQYVPVKKYEIYDGTTFQWFMCNGILFVGLVVAVASQQLNSCTQEVVFGGVLWGIANYLVLPLVKLLGIGLGFSMYHFVNLAVAYLIGRWGLFGVPFARETFGGSLLICDIGFVTILASFVGMIFVEQEDGGPEDLHSLSPPIVKGIDEDYRAMYRRWRLGESRGSTDLPVSTLDEEVSPASFKVNQAFSVGGFSVYSPVSKRKHVDFLEMAINAPSSSHETRARDAPILSPEKFERQISPLSCVAMQKSGSLPSAASVPRAQSETTGTLQADSQSLNQDMVGKQLSNLQRKFFGVLLALVTGALCGMQSIPATLHSHTHPESPAAAVVLPHCLGIWLASTSIYLLYSSIARIQRWRVPHSVIRPAFLSGCFWSSGFGLMIVGIRELGYSAGYSIDAVGPILVSSLLSVLVFKEIKGTRNLIIYSVLLTLQFLGVVLIACFCTQA